MRPAMGRGSFGYYGSAASLLASLLIGPQILPAQGITNVLLVVNDASRLSRDIGQYYSARRGLPATNICHIRTAETEEIDRPQYDREIASPIGACLTRNQLREQILYIVTTGGVPLKIPGSDGMQGDYAAVDSELTLLYSDFKQGKAHPIAGPLVNPFFGKREAKFAHPEFPMYLVTRLQAYDLEGVKAIIDRSLQAVNRGKFVIDTESEEVKEGNTWLRQAANLLPKDRVIFDDSIKVLYDQTDVIGYASWGSNDKNRHRRFLGFQWLPGAIATEFVSTNARTFKKPPDNWNISDWTKKDLW